MSRPKRRNSGGEFFAQWCLEADVERAARAGGAGCVAVWAVLRAWAGIRKILAGEHSPTIAELAKSLRMSRRTVERHLAKLKAAGILHVIQLPGRKPTWVLEGAGVDLRQIDGGYPTESTDTPANCRGTYAKLPHPPRHIEERLRERLENGR